MYSVKDLSDNGYRFFIFSIVTPIIAAAAVFLRLGSRKFITKSFGFDDWLLLLSLVGFIMSIL